MANKLSPLTARLEKANSGAEKMNFPAFLERKPELRLVIYKTTYPSGILLHRNASWRHVNGAILLIAVKEREICFECWEKELFREMASSFEIDRFAIRHFPNILPISAFILVSASRMEIIHRELSQSRKLIANERKQNKQFDELNDSRRKQ